MGIPVVFKQKGGLPIRVTANGLGAPMTIAANGRGTGATPAKWGIPACFPALMPFALGDSLLGWWDASYGVAVTGSGVSSWLDRVRGYNLVQTTDAARPPYSATGFNGFPGLTFDGVDDFLTMESQPFPSGAAPSEIWLVVQQSALVADTTNRAFFAYGGNAATTGRTIQRTVSTLNRARTLTGTGSSVTTLDTTVDLSSRHVIRAAFGAASTNIYIDGGAATNAAAVPTTGAARVRVGSSLQDTPTGFLSGKVRDAIVTGPLTTAQATALQTFLLARRAL